MAIFYDGLDDINLTSGRHVSIPDPRFFTLSVHQTAKTIPQPQYFKHKPLGVISFFFLLSLVSETVQPTNHSQWAKVKFCSKYKRRTCEHRAVIPQNLRCFSFYLSQKYREDETRNESLSPENAMLWRLLCIAIMNYMQTELTRD